MRRWRLPFDLRGAPFFRLFLPDVRGLPRSYWVLFIASAVDRIGGFVVPYLAIYLTVERGLSIPAAGAVVSAYGLGGIVGAPVGGVLSDRLGRRPLIVGAWLLTALALLHLSTARAALHLGLAVLIVGVTVNLGRPAMSAAIADVVPEADRARAYGLHYWVTNLGFAVAATLAAPLTALSFRLVFVLDAVSAVLAATFIFFALPEPRVHSAIGASPRSRLDVAVLRDRTFLAVFLGGVVTALLFSQGHVALATEIARDGMPTLYGPIIAINGVLIVLLQPIGIRVAARFRAPGVLAAGGALTGVGFFLTAFANGVLGHAGAIAVWTLGEILLAAVTPAIIARLAPPERRGTYQGFFQLAWPVAAFAPALGAWVLDTHGSLALWGGCLMLALGAAAVQSRIRDPRLRGAA